jgi:hypothetical protein
VRGCWLTGLALYACAACSQAAEHATAFARELSTLHAPCIPPPRLQAPATWRLPPRSRTARPPVCWAWLARPVQLRRGALS